MSICLHLKHASEIDQARYRRDGLTLADLQGTGDDRNDEFSLAELEAQERIFAARAAAGQLDQLGRAAQARIARRLALKRGTAGAALAGPAVLDLHKSWHVLHFALTGSADGGALPDATLLTGGTEFGRDLGYGRARIVGAELTRAFATFLTGADIAALADRLDPKVMRALNIYGASRSRARLREELEHELPRLRNHVRAAANGGMGLLIWMM